MSSEALAWVYRHSPFKGATFQVHLAIGDSVNDQHDQEFWMTQRRLAVKARVSRQAANQAIEALVQGGFMDLLEDRPGHASRYRFMFPSAEVIYESRRQGVSTETTPHPVDNRSADGDGVSTQTTGVSTRVTPGVNRDDTEPKRTQADPKNSSSPPQTNPAVDDPAEEEKFRIEALRDLDRERIRARSGRRKPISDEQAWVAENIRRRKNGTAPQPIPPDPIDLSARAAAKQRDRQDAEWRAEQKRLAVEPLADSASIAAELKASLR